MFEKRYRGKLFWGPANGIFQPTRELKPFSVGDGQLGFDPLQFPTYVTKSLNFPSNFEALDTKWKGKEDDITKANFDYEEDSYFTSLCAAYILFAKTGICSKHFGSEDDIPAVITSIMRYFVYYNMKRFLKILVS